MRSILDFSAKKAEIADWVAEQTGFELAGDFLLCRLRIEQILRYAVFEVLTLRHVEPHKGARTMVGNVISEGNFALATFDIRLPLANLVVWLDRPRLSCAWRAITRVFRPGREHRIGDLAKVLRFIWNFDRINRPRIEAIRIAHGPNAPVCRLTNNREIATFLSSYDEDDHHVRR